MHCCQAFSQPGKVICCQLLLSLGTSICKRLTFTPSSEDPQGMLYTALPGIQAEFWFRLGFRTPESRRTSSHLKANSRTLGLPGEVGHISCVFALSPDVCLSSAQSFRLISFFSSNSSQLSLCDPVKALFMGISPLHSLFVEVSRKECDMSPCNTAKQRSK